MWPKLREFLFEASGWAVASNGASLVLFVVWVVSTSKYGASVTSNVLLVISALLFCGGTFAAFNNKANELEAEKARNAKPDLVGRVLLVVLRGTGSFEGVPNSQLAIRLSVTSKTPVETTLQDAELIVHVKGSRYDSKRYQLQERFDVYNPGGIGQRPERMLDLVATATYEHPVKHLVGSEGWLAFGVKGLDLASEADKPRHGDLTITLIDEIGNRHVIEAKDVLLRPGR